MYPLQYGTVGAVQGVKDPILVAVSLLWTQWLCVRGELSLSSTPHTHPGNQQKCILPFAVFLPSIPSRCLIEPLILRMLITSMTLGLDPPWSCAIRLITIWPHPLSLSSALFFYSSNHWTLVSLSHCMALDIMQIIKPETLHPTSEFFLWFHGAIFLLLWWLTIILGGTTFFQDSTPDIIHWGGGATKRQYGSALPYLWRVVNAIKEQKWCNSHNKQWWRFKH